MRHEEALQDLVGVGPGRRRRDGPTGFVEALPVGLSQIEVLAGYVAIDELFGIDGGPAAVVGRLQMSAHQGRPRQTVAGSPGLARDLKPALLDKPLEGTPGRRRARLRGDMAPYGFPPGTRVVRNVVEDGLVSERHETKQSRLRNDYVPNFLGYLLVVNVSPHR